MYFSKKYSTFAQTELTSTRMRHDMSTNWFFRILKEFVSGLKGYNFNNLPDINIALAPGSETT